jgi:hypothetical protein
MPSSKLQEKKQDSRLSAHDILHVRACRISTRAEWRGQWVGRGGHAPARYKTAINRPEHLQKRSACSGAYSIISSARSKIDCGISMPRVFAVLRLMVNSNLLGSSTGRSAGFAPLRILSTYVAARRQRSGT